MQLLREMPLAQSATLCFSRRMQPAVFLDRDNTLIANDGDLGDPNLVFLMPGTADAVRLLAESGFVLVSVSNQGAVARGVCSEEDVRAVNHRLDERLKEADAPALTAHYFCPYHPNGDIAEYTREHPWRKPSPGMILDAAREHEIDLSRSWLIGDQARDMQAGKAAGCRTILVGEWAVDPVDEADHRCDDVLAAARLIREKLGASSGEA